MKSLQNLSYKTLFTILFFAIAGIVFFLKIGGKTTKVSAAWWDEMWHYRKAISIENSSGTDLTDFQVSISIGTSQLIADGKMQTDCDDIRITDINGNLLPHWIEENNPGCNQLTDTKIWLKANSLPTSGSTVYIYYGNQQADNNEDGDGVFEFFDDFNDSTFKNGWNIDFGVWQIGTTDGQSCATIYNPNIANNYLRYTKYSANSSFVIELQTLSNINGTPQAHPGVIFNAEIGHNDQFYWRAHQQGGGLQKAYYNGSLQLNTSFNSEYTWSNWMNTKIIINGDTADIYQNESLKASTTGLMYDGTYSNIGLASHGYSNNYYNYIFVCKYASADPTPSLQSEETGTGPIAYWKFDEGSGTTAYDSVSSNNSTLSGTTIPEWQTEENCISGKCLSFNGTNNYIQLTTVNNIKSISMWVYIPSGQTQSRYLLDARTGLSGGWLYNGSTGGNWIKMYINGIQQSNTSFYKLPTDQWFHLYMESNTIFSDDINLMSRYSNNEFLSGKLDEVKLYSYARTADQIKQDYNSRGSMSGSSVNLGVQSNTSPSLKSSLVAYWKFDEGEGTTAYNSGNGGTAINGIFGTGDSAPSWTNEGKNGKALNFDGVNDYLMSNNIVNLYGSTTNGSTVSLWVKYLNSNYIFAIDGWYNRLFDGQWTITDANNNYYYLNLGNIGDGNWHHVVYTLSGRTLKAYKDGNLTNTTTTSSDVPTRTGTMWLGNVCSGSSCSYFFNGSIDEFKIYNKALTPEEIKQDYNQGSAIQFGQTNQTIGGTTTSLKYCIPGDASYCAPPVAEWNFEENTGTIAKDTSGNNNNGTFGTGNSAPTWSLGQNNKGSAVNFINDASYIDNTSIIYGDSYTAEAWIKPTDLSIVESYGRTIIASSPTTNYPIWLLLRGNQIRAYAFSDSLTSYFIDSNFNNIQTNNWYHISLTATKNGQANLYINGILDSTFTTGAQATAQKLTIADLRPGRNISFKGSIDQIKIYNYIRTPAQIAYDYNRGGPIGWWKLDECQGSTAFDSSGLGNTGVISIGQSGTQTTLGTCQTGTSAAWTNGASGKINSSISFDGTDDVINLGNINPVKDNDFTVSFWSKINNFQYYTGVGKGVYTDGQKQYQVGFGTNGVPWVVLNNGTNKSVLTLGNALNTNTWYHLTYAFDRDNLCKVYVNGNLWGQASITSYQGDLSNSNDLLIGKYQSIGTYTSGQIDDVRIYNYALTSEQVKTVYNGGAVNFR